MESALFTLKAELVRKKEEAIIKNKEKNDAARRKQLEKKSTKHIDKKASTTVVESKEDLDLKKSREALERKSALYEKMKNGTEVFENDELNEKFLVNFQDKITKKVEEEKEECASNFDNKDEDDSSWVDYVDSFGRTRRCLVTDLEYFKQMDKDVAGSVPKILPQKDPQTEKLHAEWEKIEEESHHKRDIHYEDVLFNEAREHGVGYVAFSRNEVERNKQQQMLKDFRKQANKATKDLKKEKALKDKKMKIRLEKVRERKRLKMGLPIKDILEKRLATPPSSDNEEEPEEKPVTPPPPPVNPTDQESKPMREWDIGKTTRHGTVLTQKEWVESRRKKRDMEFAPPPQYNTKLKREYPSDDAIPSSSSVPSECSFSQPPPRNPLFAPPPTFEYYNRSTKKHLKKPKVDIEAAISRGIAAIRKASEKS